VTEIAGSFSGFGEQLSSRRSTFPKHSIGKGGRTEALCCEQFEHLQRGKDTPAADVQLPVCLATIVCTRGRYVGGRPRVSIRGSRLGTPCRAAWARSHAAIS
jgi:hypothetical protein